jgi:hypothetical protein
MGITYKILGQTIVVANTSTGLYTTPALTSTIISSIVVCNTGTSQQTFRIAITPGTISSVAIQDYIYYDVIIPSNDTFVSTAGLTMTNGNTIMVRASSADVVFSCFGSEISA